ncbi:alkylated DNA repair protein [Dendrobium catenatum]|uniref:Alkylated DNA repair protein n=1 Tax=Dendrobium catenatum TaxID=906689 RepID=A0A2I0WZW3_9ASPA|nr:alkylated DNA repair protein [Dendrobium catenatum]
MNGQLALFMLMFDGKLSVDEKFVPTYTGGKNRPLRVSINTKFEQLKFRVLKALKIDASRYTVNIVCRFPVGNDLIATHVDDDEVCDIVISQAIGVCLILYVEVEEKGLENNTNENLTSQFRESFSLDDEVEMHGGGPMHLVEEHFHVRHGQNQRGQNAPSSSAQPSWANMSGAAGCRVIMPVVDEGYEAMDSGSGKQDCDSTDELTPNHNEASLSKSSLNTKVGQSSSLCPIRRSRSPQSVESQRMQTSPKKAIGASPEKRPGSESEEGRFDISIPANEGPVILKKSLLVLKREKRKELERPVVQYLRPGMVLLKKFLGHMDQVKIVKKCRELGIGSGGFYRPGYRDGGKLHLQMMCLGKDWSPESRSYDKSRSFDGAVPPEIPEEFRKLVDQALNDSHKYTKNVEEIPNMSPDICIVNFYSYSGRLGLHQVRLFRFFFVLYIYIYIIISCGLLMI